MNIKNTKMMVYETLRDYPETRNSDRELRVVIYKRYFGTPEDVLRIIESLPDPESIRRSRQKIQETEFKADEKVRKFRKQQEKKVRDDLGFIPDGEEGVRYHQTMVELDKGYGEALNKDKPQKQDKLFEIPANW